MIAQFQIINKVLQNKDYSFITLNNLTAEHFYGYQAEYEFIKAHYNTYHTVPDRLTFVQHFPEFVIQDVNEPDNYLIEQLYNDYNQSYLATRLNNLKKLLEADDTTGAMQYFKDSLEKLHTGSALQCTDIMTDTSRYDRYLDMIANQSKYFISTGFPELDKIITGIDRRNENMVIAARSGVGKCLEKGTKVMMADGTLKKVEDVVVGDRVQSYNRVNTVLGLHNGVSNGYRIIPNVGEPFTVSSNHILTLYKYDQVCKNHHMVNTGTGHLEDIMIEDFLALSNHKKNMYKLFRPAIEYETKEQLIDPYIFGVWLGDGTSRYGHVCTADYEIVDALAAYAIANNMNFTELTSQRKGNASTYSITSFNGGESLYTLLKKDGVINNKHIPLNYLTGDRDQRLALLAGLLDTDGCYIKQTKAKTGKSNSLFEFVNKNSLLMDQFAQLCRGLGFKVCECKPKRVNTKEGITEYRRMHISGDLSSIPTKIKRKQAVKTNHISTNTGFKIEPVDRIEYYGFMCDGDSRYLLADNTLTHNTWVMLAIVAAAAKQGLTVGIYSGEMSVDKVAYRLDTLLGKIDNKKISRGDLYYKDHYKNYLDSLKCSGYGPIKVLTPNDIAGPATVDALQAFIEKENLDILFVDQYSLLEDNSRAKVAHEKVANISKSIKNLQVLKQIPIIAVSQMNRTKNEDKSQDTSQIALSDRIGQDATVILMLDKQDAEDPNHPGAHKVTVNIVKSRDGGDGRKLDYLWNFNTGDYRYISNGNDGVTSEEDFEEIENSYSADYPVTDDECPF